MNDFIFQIYKPHLNLIPQRIFDFGNIPLHVLSSNQRSSPDFFPVKLKFYFSHHITRVNRCIIKMFRNHFWGNILQSIFFHIDHC